MINRSISESPLPSNPLLSNNSTHVILTWSPPFLWPGQAIQYYNVSITNTSDGITTYHKINSMFNDVTVTYTRQMPSEIFICTEIIFGVSAVNQSGYALHNFITSSESCMHFKLLNLFSLCIAFPFFLHYMAVVEMSTRQTEFPSNAINTRVLYREDGSFAYIEAYIQVSFSNACIYVCTLIIWFS